MKQATLTSLLAISLGLAACKHAEDQPSPPAAGSAAAAAHKPTLDDVVAASPAAPSGARAVVGACNTPDQGMCMEYFDASLKPDDLTTLCSMNSGTQMPRCPTEKATAACHMNADKVARIDTFYYDVPKTAMAQLCAQGQVFDPKQP